MNLTDFIKPVDETINGCAFRLSHIRPTEAQTILPRLIPIIRENGEDLSMIMLPEDLMLKIIKWSAKQMDDGGWYILDDKRKIDDNLDYPTLLELQVKMIKLNFDFLTNGGLLKILGVEPPAQDSNQK